jgi:hypothetical protein
MKAGRIFKSSLHLACLFPQTNDGGMTSLTTQYLQIVFGPTASCMELNTNRKTFLYGFKSLTITKTKNAVFWNVAPCRSCRKIRERGTSTPRAGTSLADSPTLKMVAIRSPKRRFTQDLHGATSQKRAFFIVTAVKTSNLTYK